jgi:hypothetical protein
MIRCFGHLLNALYRSEELISCLKFDLFHGFDADLTRKPNREDRTLSEFAVNPDTSMVEIYDPLYYAQPQARAGKKAGFLSFFAKKFGEKAAAASSTMAEVISCGPPGFA